MNSNLTRAALLAATLLPAGAARADFQAALGEYNAGHYDAAHAQFLELAELGDCSSQFNLGAMALKGQGGPKDTGSGVGWLQAAAGNGCEKLVGSRLTGLTAQLRPDEARAAAAVVSRYGHEALKAQGVVSPDFSCGNTQPARVLDAPLPDDPRPAGGRDESAIVITELTVGTDGLARDPEILLSVPERGFRSAAVEAWLNSRFAPAQRNGQPVESRLTAKMLFTSAAVTLANIEAYRQARPAADSGDPAAGYVVGLTATLDSSLGLSSARGGELLLASARDGYPQAQYWVANQLRYATACRGRSDGSVWLRHAAQGGNAAAQVTRARDLLTPGASPAQIAEARALLEKAAASDSYYVMKHVTALLAASPLDAVRDPATAQQVATRLSGGEIQSDPQMFEAVAAADAANADYRGASAAQQLAVRKAQTLGWNTRAMSERLAAYKSGKPWHGDLFAY
jgi:TPR repeat protein